MKGAKRKSTGSNNVDFSLLGSGNEKMELSEFLSLTSLSYLDPSKAQVRVKRKPMYIQLLEIVRPSTTANSIFVLRKENANKAQIINSLHAQVEYHERSIAALPASFEHCDEKF